MGKSALDQSPGLSARIVLYSAAALVLFIPEVYGARSVKDLFVRKPATIRNVQSDTQAPSSPPELRSADPKSESDAPVLEAPVGPEAPFASPGFPSPSFSMPDPFQMPDPFVGDLFQDMRRMHLRMEEQMNRMMQEAQRMPGARGMNLSLKTRPIRDDGSNYIVEMEASGIDKSNVEVEIDGRTVAISAKYDETVKEESNGRISHSRSSGTMHNSFTLPGAADPSRKHSVDYRDGVLRITIPKAAGAPAVPSRSAPGKPIPQSLQPGVIKTGLK